MRGTWKIVGRMTVQVRLRRRFGFERLPVVTGVTFAVTATTSVLGQGMLARGAPGSRLPFAVGRVVAVAAAIVSAAAPP